MGFLDFLKSKSKFTNSEIQVISGALEMLSKTPTIKQTLFCETEKDKKIIENKIDFIIKDYFKNRNYFNFVVLNSNKWLERFKESGDERLIEALGSLTTLKHHLQTKEYIIRQHGRKSYSALICNGEAQEDRQKFIELLKPLKEFSEKNK